jgi:hypothetical protein
MATTIGEFFLNFFIFFVLFFYFYKFIFGEANIKKYFIKKIKIEI